MRLKKNIHICISYAIFLLEVVSALQLGFMHQCFGNIKNWRWGETRRYKTKELVVETEQDEVLVYVNCKYIRIYMKEYASDQSRISVADFRRIFD